MVIDHAQNLGLEQTCRGVGTTWHTGAIHLANLITGRILGVPISCGLTKFFEYNPTLKER